MLVAALLIVSLLSLGALWLVLARLNSSEGRRARLEGELSEARERLEEEKRSRALDAAPSAEAATDGPGANQEADAERREESAAEVEAVSAEVGSDDAATVETAAAGEAETIEETTDVHALAWSMDEFFQRTTHPRELLTDATFARGVELLRGEGFTPQELLAHGLYPNVVLSCMAFEAMSLRADARDAAEGILKYLNDLYHWPRFFALRALDAHVRRPLLAEVLARLNASWQDQIPSQVLAEFVAHRIAACDYVTFDSLVAQLTRNDVSAEQTGELRIILQQLDHVVPRQFIEEFAAWQDERGLAESLKSIGRMWESGGGARAGEVFVLDSVAARVSELETALKREPPRSVILVGDSGVGKTAIVRALAERLRGEHWVVFEASAAEVLAGQQYIGQLEERVQAIVRQVGGRRVLWFVPNFQEMLWAGQHKYSPTGMLDLLMPSIEGGQVKLVGEVPSAAYEQLMRLRPKLRTAMQTCRVAPLGDAETLELGRRWAERHGVTKHAWEGMHEGVDTSYFVPRVSEQTLCEAFQLAKQYLGDKAAPGNLLGLLDATHRRLLAEEDKAKGDSITPDDLLVTLSQLTGLPMQILDEREGLDLSELREFFEGRVLGQPEAVECLVERVALVKAGLTDPTRPQGVFLFVGPTGTGKTEIAKTLAEFLFGSPDRMIRLDMSEFQTPETLDRILGESHATSDTAALVNLIRKQPFSVVLLDEFEKAHPQVWDLFLQVFDDGRLTDRRGNTADFRHSVIIMTSNLGATLPTGASIGFSKEQEQFAAGAVERAVGRAFRREFVNRIDRVVVFRPLARGVMRDLLRKELNDVLHRRGLRTRQWAVEWDESAIDFLLERGFTADLGARPLKRAVERYLLAPLALTIVNHQFPEGDQFLFVRSAVDGQSLDVRFVDPDAPEEQANAAPSLAEEDEEVAVPAELRVETVALDPRGAAEEVQLLQERFGALAAQVDSDEWRRRKESALAQTQTDGFWNSPERFSVLGLAEYMDRIETGLDTAGSLLARLRGDRKRLPPDVVGRLAEQLYLLDAALRGLAEGEPRDAFLLVRAVREPGARPEAGDRFARLLAGMYRRWAEKRRMRFELLDEGGGDDDAGNNGGGDAAAAGEYRALAAVSGYAAFRLLRPESGLHVLETPQDEKSFNRARVLVRVVGQPDEPAGHGAGALRRQAERALGDAAAADQQPQIVRRYREEPSPLVRDSVRGWRTGKLERVLEGDFDLMQ